MQKSRTYIIVHGAWQDSRPWRAVADAIRQQGHQVILFDLPGQGSQQPTDFSSITLQTYVDAVSNIIQTIPEDQCKILVGHSLAGMIMSQASDTITVDNLVFVTAFLPVDGESILSLNAHNGISGLDPFIIPDYVKQATRLNSKGASDCLFNCCPPDITEKAVANLQYQPIQPSHDSVTLSTKHLQNTPIDYIECLQDQCISIKLQRHMYQRYDCKVHTLDTDHSPFLSAKSALIYILLNDLSIF